MFTKSLVIVFFAASLVAIPKVVRSQSVRIGPDNRVEVKSGQNRVIVNSDGRVRIRDGWIDDFDDDFFYNNELPLPSRKWQNRSLSGVRCKRQVYSYRRNGTTGYSSTTICQ